MLESLTRVGRYNIESELGRGAMGVVFKAFDPLVERTVAIKTIPLDVEGPELLVHRLQLEAKSVGQLEHPNIVTLYDAGEANGVFYLAMQFIQGETLRDRISRQRWFSIEEIQHFLRQICSALDYAHQRGVIHRDIKPSNIMITPDGVVKLTDFGIAKLAGGTTTAGLIMGTPSYMSPEQALGKPLDGRSDIFSLGSILYELITGEQAFPGSNASTVMYRIVHEPPSPITALQPGFDPTLEGIVFQALAKRPEQRYQTCADLAASVDHYVPLGTPRIGDQFTAPNALNVSPADLALPTSQSAVQMRTPRRLSLIWWAAGFLGMLFILAGFWAIVQLRRSTVKVPTPATSVTTTTATNSSETHDTASIPSQSNTPPATATSNSGPPSSTRSSAATSQVSPSHESTVVSKKPTAARAQSAPDLSPSRAAAPPTEQIQPQTFQGHMLEGDVAFQQGHYEDALAAYSKAYRMEPKNQKVRRKIAVVLTLLGRAEEAQLYK